MEQKTPTVRTSVPAKALIHVAVADRHEAMRLGWKIMLDKIGGYTVTVSVADGEGLVAARKQWADRPELVHALPCCTRPWPVSGSYTHLFDPSLEHGEGTMR